MREKTVAADWQNPCIMQPDCDPGEGQKIVASSQSPVASWMRGDAAEFMPTTGD
jgi:hypothetical protein